MPYRPCVGVVLLNAKGLVFAGERVEMPGAWQMPQGGIDEGETPEEAAYRELEEETSVPPTAVQLLGRTSDWLRYDFPADHAGRAFKGKYRGQKQVWFAVRLTAGDDVIDLETAHPEFRAWAWKTPAEVLKLIVDFKRPVYTAALEELSPHLTAQGG